MRKIRIVLMIAVIASAAVSSSEEILSVEAASAPPRSEVNLLELPEIDDARRRVLSEEEMDPVLLYNADGILPFDVTDNTYYFSAAGPLEGIFVQMEEGWQGYLAIYDSVMPDETGLQEGQRDAWMVSDGFGLYATDGGGWRYSRVIITSLPILCISTENGKLPEAAMQSETEAMGGQLQIVQPQPSGRALPVQTPVQIRMRGNTSRRFPKKSYKLKLLDEHGEKRKMSIAGLRADDDWILNPMYSDTSKIREALGYWLWGEMNSCGQVTASSSIAYVEVLLNGSYHGLYGLQERIDRKQVKGNKGTGILYKITANDRPTPEELLANEDAEKCHGLELAFSGSIVEKPWYPAADYMAILEGMQPPGTSQLSVANTIDYGLWSMLLQAKDCHFKNQFIHCVWENGAYMLYRIPWDLNHTMGDLWNGASEETNYLEYQITALAQDDCFARFLSQGGTEAYRAVWERWARLRAGALAEENLIANARRLFSCLYPAIMRDSQRWPECGMGEGNASNIRDIEDYIRTIFPRIDYWADTLGMDYGGSS